MHCTAVCSIVNRDRCAVDAPQVVRGKPITDRRGHGIRNEIKEKRGRLRRMTPKILINAATTAVGAEVPSVGMPKMANAQNVEPT